MVYGNDEGYLSSKLNNYCLKLCERNAHVLWRHILTEWWPSDCVSRGNSGGLSGREKLQGAPQEIELMWCWVWRIKQCHIFSRFHVRRLQVSLSKSKWVSTNHTFQHFTISAGTPWRQDPPERKPGVIYDIITLHVTVESTTSVKQRAPWTRHWLNTKTDISCLWTPYQNHSQHPLRRGQRSLSRSQSHLKDVNERQPSEHWLIKASQMWLKALENYLLLNLYYYYTNEAV